MLSDYLDFLFKKVSSSFLCGAGGMTIFAVIGGIDWLITHSWLEFKAKRRRERRYMRGVALRSYAGIHGIEVADDLVVPQVQERHDVLVRVMSAGTDPIDLKICSGYGSAIRFHLQRYYKEKEFPVVLGRDCSGIVIDAGKDVISVAKGDHVVAVASCYEEGLISEYIVVNESQVCLKPKQLNFQEAASIPYVGIVTMNALIHQAQLNPLNAAGNRILVYASNTPYGLLAIQLLKAWGGHVTAVVPTAGLPMCRILNSDDVIVYSVTDFQKELELRQKFDIVLNFMGPVLHRSSVDMCTIGGKVITMTTCPTIIDKYGLLVGFIAAVTTRLNLWLRKVLSIIPYRISFQSIPFDNEALRAVMELIEKNNIRPIYEVYPLEEAVEAFRQVGSYMSVGRTVINLQETKENGYLL